MFELYCWFCDFLQCFQPPKPSHAAEEEDEKTEHCRRQGKVGVIARAKCHSDIRD